MGTKTFPDVSLVRERSSPAVYLVVGDTKFWIVDPAEFDALGFRWTKVRVVDDGVLGPWRESRLHAAPRVRPSDVFFDCGNDYDDLFGRWHYNCQPSSSIVRRDVLVAGWLNTNETETVMPFVHTHSHGIEDVYFNIVLDARFAERMYGPDGLSDALAQASFPGNPASGRPLPVASQPADTRHPAPWLTFDSWVLPHQGWNLHVELNAWHRDNTGGLFSRHFVGRGTPPAFWVAPYPSDPGAFFPFDPGDPHGLGPLGAGQYVVMRGTLWQDHAHYDTGSPLLDFDQGAFAGHGGWLEMHPPDWVTRVGSAPGANARQTCAWTTLITPGTTGSPASFSTTVTPDFRPSGPSRFLEVRDVTATIDQRYTLAPSVAAFTAVDRTSHVEATATTAPTGSARGRMKCSWVVGWRERDRYDTAWVDDALPAGAVVGSDNETWAWATADPGPYVGSRCHRSATVPGAMHQHYFHSAAQTLAVTPRTTLFALVHLDPENPPDEVMLQWHTADGGWEHRAFWGDDLIGWGVSGSGSRRRMGRLPLSDEWVRLEVPATEVGLAGRTVDGMAFTLWGGRASWDYAGACTPPPPPSALVPNVLEAPYARAVGLITGAGLKVRAIGPSGRNTAVDSQSPEAGTTVERGSTVTIHLRFDPYR